MKNIKQPYKIILLIIIVVSFNINFVNADEIIPPGVEEIASPQPAPIVDSSEPVVEEAQIYTTDEVATPNEEEQALNDVASPDTIVEEITPEEDLPVVEEGIEITPDTDEDIVENFDISQGESDSAQTADVAASSEEIIAQDENINIEADSNNVSSTDSKANNISLILLDDESSINSSESAEVSTPTNLDSSSSGYTQEIPTNIIRKPEFTGPSIISQWQMLNQKNNEVYVGSDDSLAVGSQILPSGQFQVDKQVALCALVADKADMDYSVSAMINYPENIAYSQATSTRGCGLSKAQIELNKIEKDQAISLICDQIRTNNNNLLTWNQAKNESYVYAYEQVCGNEGVLFEDNVDLYCGESSFAYDDPSGEYSIKIIHSNQDGEFDVMESNMKYLELTTFESDFNDIQYGVVSQGEKKYLEGDLIWGNSNAPTVRNTGNTQLRMKIWQNDFNLGKTNNNWNVSYSARVGNIANYTEYLPEETMVLNDMLGLGAADLVNFSILIKNYPENDEQVSFFGKMVLSAERAPDLFCLLE